MRKKRIIGIVLSCAMLFSTAQAGSKAKFTEGDVLPNYLGKDQQGEKVYLAEQVGKVVVISFWASWCGPCRKELPVLAAIQKQAGVDRIKIVAVNYKESRRQFRWIRKRLSETLLTFTHDKRGSIGRKFGVEGIPHLFVVGKEGKLVYQAIGYGDKSLDKLVPVLNKQIMK